MNADQRNRGAERSFLALGTMNLIKIFGVEDDSVLEQAVGRVFEINDRMSAFKPGSDIYRLNHGGSGFIGVTRETLKLLKASIQISRLAGGAFDITVRPLVELWGIGKKQDFIPGDAQIAEVRRLVNYRSIALDPVFGRAALRQPGQAVDLGGIAKGYAADEVKRILVQNGVESGLINLGGNVCTIGNRPDGTPWTIGIQNPMAVTGQYIGTLSVSGKTIVTSGSNERFFMKQNVRYHHILDPRTGKPASNSLLSVTVVGDCSREADAVTTAAFVLGIDQGRSLLKRLGLEAIFITEDLEIVVTEGLRDKFKLLKLEQRSIHL